MRQFSLIFILFLILVPEISSQDGKKAIIPTLNFDQFEPYLRKQSDSVYIVNFWATWCIPCREELPVLEKIGSKYSSKKLKVILVSLDLPSQLQSRLLPFIKANHIKSQVILLDDPDQNKWINQVDINWSGAIPFTIIYGPGFWESYEHAFQFNELDSIIKVRL